MGNQLHLTFFFLFLSVITTGPGAYAHPGFTKLFVFGDSYVDTGNWKLGASWKVPYGITYPGKPAGHFSDGRVITDFIAADMGIEPPMPYKLIKGRPIEQGINFAHGGTGVFETKNSEPNMTAQIGLFEQLLEKEIYTKDDLKSSVALVSVSGNDYNDYIYNGGSLVDMLFFIMSVVNQIHSSLKRLHELGVQKILVMGLQPLGCLPQYTMADSYEKCNDTANLATMAHNLWLMNAVEELKNTRGSSAFMRLEMYGAYMSAMMKHREETGSSKLKDTLTPCCAGITTHYFCGDVENGEKKYTVCSDPESSFFWDYFHPTQAGMRAIYSALKSSPMGPSERELWGSF